MASQEGGMVAQRISHLPLRCVVLVLLSFLQLQGSCLHSQPLLNHGADAVS